MPGANKRGDWAPQLTKKHLRGHRNALPQFVRQIAIS